MGSFISKQNQNEKCVPKELEHLVYVGFTDAELQELGFVDKYDEEKAIMPENSHNIMIYY